MATAERILALKLLSDVGSIDKSLKGMEGRFKGFARSAASWGKAITGALVINGIENVTDALGDAWDGFRSGEKVAAQLGKAWDNLGFDGRKLKGVLDQVTDSTLELGTSDDEAVAAFTHSIQRTRDYGQSLRELNIAQDLVANGSAPNLESAFKMIQQASKGSARVVDRFGLDAETAGGRVRQLGDQVKGAAKKAAALDPFGVTMNRIAEGMESIVGGLAKGSLEDALDGVRGIGKALSDAIFGYDREITKRNKKGQKISVGVEHVGGIAEKAEQLGEQLLAGIRTAIGNAAASIDLTSILSLQGLGNALANAINLLAQHSGVLASIGAIGLALGTAFAGAMFVANLFTTAALAVFSLPLWAAKSAVGVAVGAVGAVLGAAFRVAMWTGEVATAALASAATSAIGIIAGNSKVLGAAKGLGKALGAAVRVPLLGALGPIGVAIWAGQTGSEFLASIGWAAYDPKAPGGARSKLQDRIDELTGKKKGATPGRRSTMRGGFAEGLWEVPRDMVAPIHRGESIVPADFAERLRQTGTLASDARPSVTNNHVNVTINAGAGSDPVTIGRELDRYLSKFYAASGGVRAR